MTTSMGLAYFSDGEAFIYGANEGGRHRFDDNITSLKARFAAAQWPRCLFLYSRLGNDRDGIFIGRQLPPWNAVCVIEQAEGTFEEMWAKFEAYARML